MIKHLIIFAMFLFLLPLVAASDAPNVTLVSPAGENISTSSSVNFLCNVTDDENAFNISLYTNISGVFSIQNTTRIMELVKDSYTQLMCRFENNYICEDGESGTNTSTDFVSSKVMNAVRINDSDTLTYPTSDNINYQEGTIEFLFNPGFDPSSPPDSMFLYSTGNTGEDQIDIYVDYYGTLYFYFYDYYGYTKTAFADISGWNQGEWHHIAVLWEYLVGTGDMRMDLFLDGSNGSTSISGTYYAYGGPFGSTMYIGSDGSSQYQAYSSFDELRISNISRTPDEINASYMKGTGNHSKESASWTINISDGFYKWNCLAYDNESQASWNDTNLTFYVDTSSPATNELTVSPNSTDEVDPESTVNITANVTDLINVSHVFLQWKETGSWNNDTMDYNISTGLYENASITFEETGGVYYYRIWSNDTLGHEGHSPTYNITADWDYTWNRSPSDMGTAYGTIGCSNCYVGIIIINNTGDDSLSIQMTDNWPLSIYYNVSNPFSIGPKEVVHINVTSQFSSEDSEYDVVINITASHGTQTPYPLYQTVAFKLNSYSGGPYFDNDDIIISSPTSVYQGTSYNLSARLRNIGNETATGIWLNWTLPDGWTNTTGNLSGYIGNLNGTVDGGNEAFNNITVYLQPGSASAGVHNIYVNSSSAENLTGNKTGLIYVLCNSTDGVCGAGCNYFSDSNCPQPTGGGTTTTSPPTMAGSQPSMSVNAPDRFYLIRGESGTFHVDVRNTVSGTSLKNVTLQISGYPQIHIKITPAQFYTLGYETKRFTVEVTVPEYMAYGGYELTLKAQGKHSERIIKADAETILFVHSVSINDTIKTIKEAEDNLDKMAEKGINTEHLSLLLEQANKALDELDYDRAEQLGNEVARISEIALRVNDILRDIENKIQKATSYGIETPETQKMYALSLAAFQRGDYERSEERAESALLTYSIETGGVAEVLSFVYDYWWILIVVIIIIIVSSWKVHRIVLIKSISGKLIKLEKEEKEVLGMIGDYQKKYWKDSSISLDDYQKFISDGESKMLDIRKSRSDLSIKKIKLTVRDVLKGLEKELESIKNSMNNLQKKYFSEKGLSKSSYLMMMNGMNAEIANIQQNIDMIKSGNESRKSRKAAFAIFPSIIIVLLMLSVIPYVNALGDKDSALESIQLAENEIQSMIEMGFGISYVNDTLSEAKLLYEQDYYMAAQSLAEKVTEIKETAIEIDSLIDEVEEMIYETSLLGIDVSPAQETFNQAMNAFDIEDYTNSKSLLTQSINKLDELESEAALQKALQKTWYSELYSYLAVYWIPLLVVIIIILSTVFGIYFSKKKAMLGKELKKLENEKKSLEKLIEDLQTRYFKNSLIGKSEYERLKNQYRKSIVDIERQTKVLGD